MQTPEPQNRLIYIYKIALVASIGGFLFGYDLVIISGAILFIEAHFALTATLKGFVVSSAILGALIGPLAGLWFTDRIGRRKTMMASAAFFCYIDNRMRAGGYSMGPLFLAFFGRDRYRAGHDVVADLHS